MLRSMSNLRHFDYQHQHADALRWLADLGQDIRYFCHVLRRTPGLYAAMILTLALGIGANTAVFSIVNAVLLKPLPYFEPNHIVVLVNTIHGRIAEGLAVSAPKFTVWRQTSTAVGDVTAYTFGRTLDVTHSDDPEPIPVGRVSVDFFRLFGARITQGRTFTAEEDRPGGPHVAIISDAYWRSRLGGRSPIIGQTLSLDGDRFTIVGVLDASFDVEAIKPSLALDPAVWLPLQIDPESANDLNYLLVAGRLRPGVSVAAARVQAALAAEAVRRTLPAVMSVDNGLSIEPLQTVVVRNARPLLILLWSVVVFVLLVACANVTNLLLVRAAARRREIAVRVATGASQGRIVRQLLTEGLVLATAGSAVGLAVAIAGTRMLLSVQGWKLPRIGGDSSRIPLDWHVLLFTIVTAAATGIAFGLVPAFQAAQVDLAGTLKPGGGSHDARGSRTRSLLVVCEVALALTLLIGAAMLIRSFVALRQVRPGFDGNRVLTMQTAVIGRRFTRAQELTELASRGVRRLNALADVEIAAISLTGPPLEPLAALNVGIVGRPRDDEYSYPVHWNLVSPEYFETLKIPLLIGRRFDDRDRAGSPGVVLINQAMAKRYWRDADPLRDSLVIAPRIGGELEETAPRRIIGVVGDVRQYELRYEPRASVYVPLNQLPDGQAAFLNRFGASLTWMIRTRDEPYLLADTIQREVRAASGLPVVKIRSMNEVSAASTSREGLEMRLLAVFGAVALVLAVIGLYGVVSYSVERRRREIGIRMALGAERRQLRRMVISQAMKMTSLGVALGLVGSLGLSRLIVALLFGVEPYDGVSFVAVPLVVATVALGAAWLPARRASAVDPAIALRAE